jgi:hypothetical protein
VGVALFIINGDGRVVVVGHRGVGIQVQDHVNLGGGLGSRVILAQNDIGVDPGRGAGGGIDGFAPHAITLGVDEVAVFVQGKMAVPGVIEAVVVGVLDDEETGPGDGHVGVARAVFQRALLPDGADIVDACPPADLPRSGAGGDHLGHEVLEVHAAVFEARGVQVGDVIAHHAHGFPETV